MKRRRRTLVIKPIQQLDARINVTPLVDVVLVLLIIFMVMTPLVERELSVSLATQKHARDAAEVAPTQVLVSVDGSGALQINARPVSRNDYVSQLSHILEERAAEDRIVFVIAGDSASYADLVETVDRAKQAGATTVALATEGAR